MSDEIRKAFEEVTKIPDDAYYKASVDCYKYEQHSSVDHPVNELYESFSDGWKAAQSQGGEAVAWVDVPKGDQKSSHYPGYSFHGIQFLPAGRHSLHVVPQPAVPEDT